MVWWLRTKKDTVHVCSFRLIEKRPVEFCYLCGQPAKWLVVERCDGCGRERGISRYSGGFAAMARGVLVLVCSQCLARGVELVPKLLKERLNCTVVGRWRAFWDYSYSYVSTFNWERIRPGIKVEVDDVFQLIEIAENVQPKFIVLGWEGHYSVLNNWAFLYLEGGQVLAVNVRVPAVALKEQ